MSREKTYDYIVTLKPGTNTRVYDWISHILLFLALIATLYYTIILQYVKYPASLFNDMLPGTDDGIQKNIVIGAILTVLIFGSWVVATFRKAAFRYGLFVAAFAWFWLYSQYILAILYLIAGLLENQAKQPVEIGFDRSGVTINGIPRKNYTWDQLNQVLMKDGIITLDFKNNKLIQRELDEDVDAETESEFNRFCSGHLQSGAALQ